MPVNEALEGEERSRRREKRFLFVFTPFRNEERRSGALSRNRARIKERRDLNEDKLGDVSCDIDVITSLRRGCCCCCRFVCRRGRRVFPHEVLSVVTHLSLSASIFTTCAFFYFHAVTEPGPRRVPTRREPYRRVTNKNRGRRHFFAVVASVRRKCRVLSPPERASSGASGDSPGVDAREKSAVRC